MFWLPLFFWFHGVPTTDPVFLGTSAYVIGVAVFCAYLLSLWFRSIKFTAVDFTLGFLKWYSRLYRNQGSLLYGPGPFDWGEQIIVITGGMSAY